jgi:hypothetical protein
LGPTITLMPGANSSFVLSAKDLKPRMLRDRRNIGRSMLATSRRRTVEPPQKISGV